MTGRVYLAKRQPGHRKYTRGPAAVCLERGAPLDRIDHVYNINGRAMHPVNVKTSVFPGCGGVGVNFEDIDAHGSRMCGDVCFDEDQRVFRGGGSRDVPRRNRMRWDRVVERCWDGVVYGEMEWRQQIARAYACELEGVVEYVRLRDRVRRGLDVRISCVPLELREEIGVVGATTYVAATCEMLRALYESVATKRFPHEVVVAMLLSGNASLL